MDNISLFHPYTSENVQPGFSIDCIFFTYHAKKIKILLNRFNFSDMWQLPGGFMLKTENAEEAANRIAKSRIGSHNGFLRQFHLFSDVNRTEMQQNTSYITQKTKKTKIDGQDTQKWFLNRFVSLGFYALVRYEDVKIENEPGDQAKWFDVDNLPKLYSDHLKIIQFLFSYIKEYITVIPFAQKTLPEKFKMSDLRRIYEVILDKSFDRRNFARKLASLDILVELEKVSNVSTYNPPKLYTFNPDKGIIDFSFLK